MRDALCAHDKNKKRGRERRRREKGGREGGREVEREGGREERGREGEETELHDYTLVQLSPLGSNWSTVTR